MTIDPPPPTRQPTAVGAVLLMQLDVRPEDEAEFTRWYDREHIPELLALPGFLSARRFEAVGDGIRFLAIYELESAAALETKEYRAWREASDSTRRMLPKFTARARHVYRTLSPTGDLR